MNDITTRARALLADATPGPWQVRSGSGVAVEAVSKARGMRPCGDPYPLIAKMPKSYASDYANAALIAAAPELIAALCDQLDDALEECRLKRAADEDFLDDYTDGYLSEVEDQLAAAVAERNALRAEVEKEAAMRAEMAAEIKRLRSRKAEVCDCVHGTGMIGESFVDVDANCPKCGRTGGVIVEGEQ